MKATFQKLLALTLVLLLTACGGSSDSSSSSGSGSTSGSTTTTEVKLKSIAITPANATVAIGMTLQLVATSTYSDGKSSALTTGVTWSTVGGHSTIFTNGLVTGVSLGDDTVTAKVGDIVGTLVLSVKGPYRAMAAGGGHTVARLASGSLQAWGLNRSGQLGDGTAVDRLTPTAVSGTATTWTNLAAGDFHSVGLRSDGSLWAWGFNQNGQLGDKTFADKSTPVQVGTDKNWTAVSAGKAHTLGVKKDGTLWAWGRNFDSQLGDGTVADRASPVQVLMPTASTGTGTGTTTTTPTATAADKTWTAVAAGANFSVGRKTDSTIYTWGGNESGQLGRGSSVTVLNAPVVVPDLRALSIAAGASHALAIRSDGALFAWGSNVFGQLGHGTNADASSPKQVMEGTSDWAMIAAGAYHSLAVKTDGTLWAWGANVDGQLGTGDTSDVTEPLQVGMAKDWVAVVAGKSHSFALKADGTLWGWGRNAEGQLGNGMMSVLPVLVPTLLP